MRVGSLFSGIGGLDLGFERAGFEIAWQVEIDGYCRRVLAKHWPDVPKYEDVRDVGSANLEWVDVIVGGFPCQDISNAGKRAGITGERSGLWSEFYRVVCEVRPRYVVVENVAALLHRGIDRVLGDLAEGGYDAEWDCLPAVAFGALHRRDRLFLVAYTHDTGRLTGRPQAEQERQYQEVGRGEQSKRNGGIGVLAYTTSPRLERSVGPFLQRRGIRPASSDWWAVEPEFCGVVNGLSKRLYGGGLDASQRMGSEGDTRGGYQERVRTVWREFITGLAPQGRQSDEQLTGQFADALRCLPYEGTLGDGQAALAQAQSYLHRLRQAYETLGAVRDSPVTLVEAWQSLTEEEKDWVTMAADGGPWVGEWPDIPRVATGVPKRVDRLRGLGNSVVPQVAQYVAECVKAHAEQAVPA